MNRFFKAAVLGISLLVLGYVGLGYLLGKTQIERPYVALGVYSEVLRHIQDDYVEDPNLPLVTVGALHGMLESLDPHSSYLSPREYAEFKEKSAANYKGEIGVTISKRFGYVIVVSVLPDSPAAKAGLRAGDIFENIAGFSTREMSVAQARLFLAGQPGTGVNVGVVRRGRSEPQPMDIVRAALPAPKITGEMLKDPDAPAAAQVAILRVPALTPGKVEEVRQKLAQLEKQGAKKLILDLRDTAAGPMAEGIALAQLFLSKGKIVTLRGQTVPAQEFSADPAKVAWAHPLTVLISNSTFGAAEIAAAAIGANQRGRLVGERTFGAASEQKVIPLEDDAALILTVANYYTPAGKSIPADGVAPDVEVRREAAAAFDDEEEDAPARPPQGEESPREDRILKKAIELLLAPLAAAPTKDQARQNSRPLSSWRAPARYAAPV
ncbi:MAG TPA: S41 family peptidase [Candidatus Nitrosotenuis sp.]|nr:S41 family peptidase [Candidatus Nitrosotenuis sp.]